MQTIQEELYNGLFRGIRALNIPVYDSLPPLGVDYPFAVISNVQTQINPTKSYFIGELQITVDLFYKEQDRDIAFNANQDVFKVLRRFKGTNYIYRFMPENYISTILTDTETGEPLIHINMQAYYKAF